jgi:serine/threonine protein kinase
MELRHPNIVQFMGYGMRGQSVYIVTEFIDGGDLHLLLKTLSIDLPWQLRIAMAADVARAMAFLHAQMWVHR